MKQYLLKSLLPLGLCFLMSFDGLFSVAHAQTTPTRIDIVVMEGEGVTSYIRQRVTRDPVVKVEDEEHRPVAGAAVSFAMPVSGTTGEFASGSKTLTVMTDSNGLAAARGLRANEVPGRLQIYVTASYQGLRARGLINQVVEAPAGTRLPAPEMQTSKSGGKWKWILGIAAAGGAGAGIYFGTRKSDSPISISTGTVVFGSPR